MKTIYNGQIIRFVSPKEYDRIELVYKNKTILLKNKIKVYHLQTQIDLEVIKQYANYTNLTVKYNRDEIFIVKYIQIKYSNPVGILNSLEFQRIMNPNDLNKKENVTVFSETFIVKNIILSIEEYFMNDTLYCNFTVCKDFIDETLSKDFKIFINNQYSEVLNFKRDGQNLIYEFKLKNYFSDYPISYTLQKESIIYHIPHSFVLKRFIDLNVNFHKNLVKIKLIKNTKEECEVYLNSSYYFLSKYNFKLKKEITYEEIEYHNTDKIEDDKFIILDIKEHSYIIKRQLYKIV